MDLATLTNIFPAELATVIISTLPIAELRGSIPIAITLYNLDPIVAYVLSVLGNMIPAILILVLLGPLSGYLIERFSWAKRFFEWLFERTRRKFSGKYEKWGYIALILFVAIPLPVTGVWTGSVAAFLFGIPKKIAFGLIFLGAAIAGVIVSLATLGLISIF